MLINSSKKIIANITNLLSIAFKSLLALIAIIIPIIKPEKAKKKFLTVSISFIPSLHIESRLVAILNTTNFLRDKCFAGSQIYHYLPQKRYDRYSH